jgi:hypothetical protein
VCIGMKKKIIVAIGIALDFGGLSEFVFLSYLE